MTLIERQVIDAARRFAHSLEQQGHWEDGASEDAARLVMAVREYEGREDIATYDSDHADRPAP